MIDAKRLLDQFLGGGAGGQMGGFGSRPGVAGSGVGDLLGNLQRQAGANPLASGALAGGLASVLLGGRRGGGISQSTLKLGGLAVIAGLAYKAYQDRQARQAGTAAPQTGAQPTAQGAAPELLPPPKDTPFMPSGAEADNRARLLLTAMIAAAKADGSIDQAEQNRIFDRLSSLDVSAEDKAYLMDQLRAPLDLDGIVRQASQPEVAAEVYAASLLAIDPDHPAEKAYLQMLAARLGLADDLAEDIRRTAEAARAAA